MGKSTHTHTHTQTHTSCNNEKEVKSKCNSMVAFCVPTMCGALESASEKEVRSRTCLPVISLLLERINQV
jgi:hypothetical protein